MQPHNLIRVLHRVALPGGVCLAAFLAVCVAACWEINAPTRSVAPPAGVTIPPDLTTGPEIAAAPEILAVRRFHHDKRQPRPPRHRSERASSFSAEQDLIAAKLYSITHDDMHRAFVVALTFSPLSGHPLELLRPPSVRG